MGAGRNTAQISWKQAASCQPLRSKWDVSKAPYGSRPVWFDLSLVKVRILFADALVAQAIVYSLSP